MECIVFISACLGVYCCRACVVLVLETARMIPSSVDLVVVVFLSLVDGLVLIGPVLSALLILLHSPFLSIALRPHRLGFRYFFSTFLRNSSFF